MPDLVIRPHRGRVRVLANGQAIADTVDALELIEAGHSPVLYFPREDVSTGFVERSATRTTCPRKGEAVHFSGFVDGAVIEDLAWSYEAPLPQAAAIAGYLAFYPDKAEIVRGGAR